MQDSQLNISIGPMPVKGIELVDTAILKHIPSKREAIRVCVRMSGLTEKTVASRLNIDPGHFSRIMSGKAHFPDNKYLDLYAVCGNYLPLQWEALKAGFQLREVDTKQAQIDALKDQIKALEAIA